MNNLDRLKLELSNQKYFTDLEYSQFLAENDLSAKDEYIKQDNQKNLLQTVVDILEAVANDIDLMRNISTSFGNIGEAYQYVEMRIEQVKDKILSIPDRYDEYSAFSLMYIKGGTRTMGGIIGSISLDKIEDLD